MLGGTASPETISIGGEPIFRPTGIDHVLLNVTDPEKSAAFYEKILGPVTQRNNNRIWFQAGTGRIGLLKTPEGEKAGVNHYCVAVEKFDYDTVVKKLQQAGVKLDTPEIAGAPDLRDPDGYRVQVMGPRGVGAYFFALFIHFRIGRGDGIVRRVGREHFRHVAVILKHHHGRTMSSPCRAGP